MREAAGGCAVGDDPPYDTDRGAADELAWAADRGKRDHDPSFEATGEDRSGADPGAGGGGEPARARAPSFRRRFFAFAPLHALPAVPLEPLRSHAGGGWFA